jgi:hypothetical protein
VSKYHKEYYEKNKEKWTTEEYYERKRLWRLDNVNKTLLHSARKRSKLKDIPFDITLEDIVVPKYCPILNLELKPNQTGTKANSKHSPTLDRIKPELGYVKGNVQVISSLANVMKNCASPQELIFFADWVIRNAE